MAGAEVYAPEQTRKALLQRLADDLAVLVAPEYSLRAPAGFEFGDCCWVTVPDGRMTWAYAFCGTGPCCHLHHQYEVFLG